MFNGLKRKLLVKVVNDVLEDEVKKMPINWKTTLLGILAIIATVAHSGTQVLTGQAVDWTTMIAGIGAGLGLIHAQDAVKK